MSLPLLTIEHLTKTFGATHAVDDVDLEIRTGEVHALLGHNGAGKSTLIRCLAGAVPADAGVITLDGKRLRISTPADAIDAGIRVVYQELSLFPALTVAENLTVDDLVRSGPGRPVRRRRQIRDARAHLERLGLAIDPALRVEQLPVGEQQMLEIARALFSGARVIVLDEPTSALSPTETATLFSLVRKLAATGVAFLLVTHFLQEVAEHADRATILRGGRRIATLPVAETDTNSLVTLMLGDEKAAIAKTLEGAAAELPARSTAPIVLRVRGLSAPPRVRQVDLDLHHGEILGIYGELGSGSEELAGALYGVAGPTTGTVRLLGRSTIGHTSERIRDAGLGLIPADRRRALALGQPISSNITAATLHREQSWWLRRSLERRAAEQWIEELDIAGATPDLAAASLSGGNQQKVLLARWLIRPPKVLVLAEPTRGMDIGAKGEVMRLLRQVRDAGTALLVVSNEPETLLTLADRILVLRRGRIAAAFSGALVRHNDLVEAAA